MSAVAQLVQRLTGDQRVATQTSLPAESLCCVLEQDTLFAA